jgi:ElaB/YqjD/DUF883 family membrane-anchored ribosome-binding protein
MTQQSDIGIAGATTTGSTPTGERPMPTAAMDAVAQDRAKDDAAADFAELRRDLATLAQDVATLTQRSVEPYTRQLETMVDRNPIAAVGIAAGLGLLLGLLSAPRR